MTVSKKKMLGRSLSALLEETNAPMQREIDMRRYFLDPNNLESLQDEIIRLNKLIQKLQKDKTDDDDKKTEKIFKSSLEIIQEIERLSFKTRSLNSKIEILQDKLIIKMGEEKKISKIKEKHITDSIPLKYLNTKTYLIKNRRNGLYKIGKSKNPLQREKTLQSEEPDIVMVKTWEKNIESDLHQKYKDYRVRGEWFKLSNVQVKYICSQYD